MFPLELEMNVKTVTVDQSGSFLVILTDKEERKVLPIAIGPFEAQSIALVLKGQEPPRPLTHDLLKSMCSTLGGMVEKIIITDIRDSTFYAELYLQHKEETIVVDSRPSDAIALALRCQATIYMTPRLVEFTYDYEDIIHNGEEGEDSH